MIPERGPAYEAKGDFDAAVDARRMSVKKDSTDNRVNEDLSGSCA